MEIHSFYVWSRPRHEQEGRKARQNIDPCVKQKKGIIRQSGELSYPTPHAGEGGPPPFHPLHSRLQCSFFDQQVPPAVQSIPDSRLINSFFNQQVPRAVQSIPDSRLQSLLFNQQVPPAVQSIPDSRLQSPFLHQQVPPAVQSTPEYHLQTSSNCQQVPPAVREIPEVHLQRSFTHKLPKMTIPPFNGNITEWPVFIANFKSLIQESNLDTVQRLTYLRLCLTQSVQDSIAQFLYDPSLYQLAMEELEYIYGNPYMLALAHLKAIENLQVVKEGCVESLQNFTMRLNGAVGPLSVGNYKHELASSSLIGRLVSKIPQRLQRRWGEESLQTVPHSPTVVLLHLATACSPCRVFYQPDERCQPI